MKAPRDPSSFTSAITPAHIYICPEGDRDLALESALTIATRLDKTDTMAIVLCLGGMAGHMAKLLSEGTGRSLYEVITDALQHRVDMLDLDGEQ